MDRELLEKLAGGLLTGGMTTAEFLAMADEPGAASLPNLVLASFFPAVGFPSPVRFFRRNRYPLPLPMFPMV